MLDIKQINQRLKEIELEKDFLYDQLMEMKFIADDVAQSALEYMNGGEQHA